MRFSLALCRPTPAWNEEDGTIILNFKEFRRLQFPAPPVEPLTTAWQGSSGALARQTGNYSGAVATQRLRECTLTVQGHYSLPNVGGLQWKRQGLSVERGFEGKRSGSRARTSHVWCQERAGQRRALVAEAIRDQGQGFCADGAGTADLSGLLPNQHSLT